MLLLNNPKIISNAASIYFGLNNRFALDSAVLEATLRYISIKSNSGDIENTNFIKVKFHSDTHCNFSPSDVQQENTICIHKVRAGCDVSLFPEDGWSYLDNPPFPTARFLSQFSATQIAVNNSYKCAVVVVKNPTEKWIDNFCSALYRILTWLYPQNSTPTQEEIALFRAINTGNGEEFSSIVDSCYGDIDFEAHITKKLLTGWANKSKDQQIINLQNQRKDIEQKVANYEQNLHKLYQDLSNVVTSLNQWMKVYDKDDLSVYNFFQSHKQLSVLSTSQNGYGASVLYYSILETLEYFDEDAFMAMYKEKRSILYDQGRDFARRICYETFINKRGKFRFESQFMLTNVTGLAAVAGVVSHKYDDISMPNPHLFHHHCLGDNEGYINGYLKTGDWDLAIEQTIAATKNLYFGDSVVFREFLGDIWEYKDRKCIVLDDGTNISPQELYDIVLKEDTEKNKSEEA